MQPIDSQTRLKNLFRELFQLDVADLDFGLYRLFHLKRVEVEAFLDKQLPEEVDRAFEASAGAEREALQKRVEELGERARATVADDAILPSGEPNPDHAAAKAVKEYVEARKRLQAVEVSEAQRAEVFNFLYAFFSRYYDDGDFIPRRFYGAHARYAVPYNGEEVLFHWANKDQYYVKTGEAFRDYAFTVPTVSGDYRVRFTLDEATVGKDNTKGDTRFFFPLPKEATFDTATRTFTLPFHYRLPIEAEVAKYGRNAKGQEAILDEAEPKVVKEVKDPLLGAALSAPSPTGREAEGEEPPTLLRRRLTHFTKKNTTDYFVHKNLGALLRQELEFFVRDQVVHEADLEGDFEAKRRTIRVFRKLADTVIEFLAQIEDAQKRLFEKKKIVLRMDYLVPIQHVPRALWPDVLANKAQIAEWKALYTLEPRSALFSIKGKINEATLEQHPTLVVDTRHFGETFRLSLLAAIPDLDDETDGLLIHGENFQALNLMHGRYREQVKCIYIDPPYNTGGDEFVYKDRYQHSSWLSMFASRMEVAKALLDPHALLFVHIDNNEQPRLRLLGGHIFGEESFHAMIAWKNKYGPGAATRGIGDLHEHILVFCVDPMVTLTAPLDEESIAQYSGRDAKYVVRGGFVTQPLATRSKDPRPNLVYPITWEGQEIWPNKQWIWSRDRMEAAIANDEVVFNKQSDGSISVRFKQYLRDEAGRMRRGKPLSLLLGPFNQDGTEEIEKLFGARVFAFPKPAALGQRLLAIQADDWESLPVILDYLAGSGTTGHAVINLNREDGGRRKFILVEMADHFDTVLVPRIKKVMFTPDWKDGKPKRFATKEEVQRTPRLVKVLRLESYEDALHNTFADKAVGRLAEREKVYREAVGDEKYRIRYLVKLPLEASDSMLNLAGLEHPFDYTLEVLTDHGPQTEIVDLVETFNWLYGLRVHRILTWVNPKDKTGKEKDGRSYRAVVASDREGKKRVLVVWRDITGLDPKVERPFLQAQAAELGPFEERWVNGDTAANGFASLDGLFKRLTGEGGR